MPARAKTELDIARERAIERLAAEELAAMSREAEHAEHEQRRAEFRAARAAERLADNRAAWNIDPADLRAFDAMWSKAFITHLFSQPIGTNGRGIKLDVNNVRRGTSYCYAITPDSHAAIIAEPPVMAAIVKAHKLPETLSWLYRGREYQLFRAPRLKRCLFTENAEVVAGRSSEAQRTKLVFTGAEWIVPPKAALPDGSDRLPELPPEFVEAFKAFSTDNAGVVALERFVLGR